MPPTIHEVRDHVVKQWPRYIVGLHAVYGIVAGVISIVSAAGDDDFPEKDKALIQASIYFFSFISILFNSIDLYAAVKRSIAAAKISLYVFAFGLGFLILSFSLMAFVYIFASEETRQQLPPLDLGASQLPLSLLILAVYGWSLFVLYRDNKGLARNAWGRLVPEAKVATVPGPIHLA